LSSAAYIVGTPWKTVTWSRWITSNAVAGSNRGTRVRQAPLPTAAFSPQVWPKEWNSGRQPMTTSSGPRSNRVVADTAALRRRLAWVSSAPLGLPVVPEVYSSTAVSWSARLATAVSGAGSPSSRSKAAGATETKPTPAASAPLPASAAVASHANSSLAPESSR